MWPRPRRSESSQSRPDLFGLKGTGIFPDRPPVIFLRAPWIRSIVTWRTSQPWGGGDGFFVDGQLVSENRQVAWKPFNGQDGDPETGSRGAIPFNDCKGQIPVTEFGDDLDILGGVAYYQQDRTWGPGLPGWAF